MRRGLVALLYLVAAAASASADPEPAEPPPLVIGYGALPGGIAVATADTLPKGSFVLGTIDSFGERSGLLGANESFLRLSGDLAGAYGIIDGLSVALSLDGRYDRHTGGNPSPDDGYVGDPHVLIRGALPAGSARVGAQLGIWIPGRNAPSIVGSAISVDLRLLASLPVGPASLSFQVGFQLDNSAASISDPTQLSLADRSSLGVSDFNELYGGANINVPFGRDAWIGGEVAIDGYVGSAPTGHASLDDGSYSLRGDISAGYHFTDAWSGLLFVGLAKSPYITAAQVTAESIPLVPYEPTWTIGIGVNGRFGGPQRASSQVKDCAYTTEGCPALEVPILADITGSVTDEAGKPVVGAKVSIKLKDVTAPIAATDEHGAYVFKGVRIGTKADASGGRPARHDVTETDAEIHVDVDGKKPGAATLATLVEGANTVPAIKLEPQLPPGQLRGVVHALPNGKPVANATIVVTPGDKKIETSADGTFQLDLAPGTYQMTVKAAGFAEQQLSVTIDPNGVAIKNIDLHK
ncbi:MAG TPA: carboxypeptidase regulatory-like domain-containing protein [Kofleriaceae bacterium]|jgi:hypothetical protein